MFFLKTKNGIVKINVPFGNYLIQSQYKKLLSNKINIEITNSIPIKINIEY